jgi:hypothetical protein
MLEMTCVAETLAHGFQTKSRRDGSVAEGSVRARTESLQARTCYKVCRKWVQSGTRDRIGMMALPPRCHAVPLCCALMLKFKGSS